MSFFDKDRDPSEQEKYEDFMNGFRRGCPVEGDPEPVIPDEPSEEYQRGLECGQSAKADFDKSTRPWWKLW